VANSILGGGIIDTKVDIQTLSSGMKIDIHAPTLGVDNYDIEIKNQFLQVYTFYGKSLLKTQDSDPLKMPILMKAMVLPPMVDDSQIDAVFEEGILQIYLPFKNKEELAARKIDIKQI